jgi:radical SAM superfamily enzyme YgiQ (UPF0313 family)
MKKAGINWVCYGFESGSEDVRKGVRKGQKHIMDAVNMTYEAGQYILANFMFGLPDDDMDSMRATLDLAKEINGEYANFYSVMAYPGSELYDDAIKRELPLPKVWHGYSQYAYETRPLPTRHVDGPTVLRFRDDAFSEYYTNPAYLKKMMGTFGETVVGEIMDMSKKKLKRKYL